MLRIEARNISELSTVSNYEVTVFINDEVIAAGVIAGHLRSLGWRTLLCRIAGEVIDRKPGAPEV